MPRSIVMPSSPSVTILGPWYFTFIETNVGEGYLLNAPFNKTELEKAGYFITGVGLTALGLSLCSPDPIAGWEWDYRSYNGRIEWYLSRRETLDPAPPDPAPPSPSQYFSAAQDYNRKINALNGRDRQKKAAKLLRRQNTLLQQGISLFD